MHLRKSRKAKAAASEFVKRVISGKNVSPDRKDLSKGSKPSTSRQTSRPSTSTQKSAGRGRPASPRPAGRPTKSAAASKSPAPKSKSPAAATRRANSRSPSKAPESKSKAQSTKQEADAPAKRSRGRPPKNRRPESPAQTVAKSNKGQGSKASNKKDGDDKEKTPEKPKAKRGRPPKYNQSSPKAKLTFSAKASTVEDDDDDSESEVREEPKVKSPVKEEAKAEVPVDNAEIQDIDPEPMETEEEERATTTGKDVPTEETSPCEGFASSRGQSPQVITPRIVFVDHQGQSKEVPSSSSGSSLKASPSCSPAAKFRMSPQLGTGSPIRISPSAKLIPVSSLSNINTAGKNVFTINIPGSSLARSVNQGQSAQFIVSAQQLGTPNSSPIQLAATATSTSPGQVTLDLMELAKSLTPEKNPTGIFIPQIKPEPESPSPPLINKSPKFLLSSGKKEPVSEGKIKKRKRPKTPAWELPSAVYMSCFPDPQPEFSRKDEDINYPENVQMEQGDYFKIMGIISKAEIKNTDGNENRSHRLAGGKLRRVCKPKISPEMVYRKFSFARGCIMHDVYVDSDDENDNGNSPKVADKFSVMRSEQSKKGSLSPKIHDSYRQHCNKIPVITLDKSSKDGSSDCETTPSKLSKSNSLKENSNPHRKAANSPKTKPKNGAKNQLDLRQGGGKALSKSKSFEVTSKKGTKPSTMAKSKSFEKGSSSKGKGAGSKFQFVVPKVEPEEEDDGGSKRRSARNRGGQRKQWWHLLRANPDEFEEDKDWERDQAVQEEKRRVRLERAKERIDGDSDIEEVEKEEEEKETEKETEKSPPKKKKKKVKKEPEGEADSADPRAYTELYETKLKNKKSRSKDWALATKVLEETKAQAKDKDPEEPTKSKSKKGKKDGHKRKASETPTDNPLPKKIKTEQILVPNSDDETPSVIEERSADKVKHKKKKSIGGATAEIEEIVDEKPEIITNLVILGEDGEPLETKHNANLYDQLQTLLESRDSEKLAQTGVLELSLPPNSPQSFIEILARKQQKMKRRPQSPLGMLPIVRSDVLYKTKEQECVTPHMCSVCWINDHMYCRNMKRIARDLPLCGGCIHYVPCNHYMQKESPSTRNRKQMQRRVHPNLYSNDAIEEGIAKATFTSPAARRINFSSQDKDMGSPKSAGGDLLMCDEILTESDSEPNSPPAPVPPGTELLTAELRARTSQIKRALGFKSLPKTISPLKRKLQWASPTGIEEVVIEEDESDEENDREIEVTEYASTETVGSQQLEVDYGVPLTSDFLIKDMESNESWATGTSIFMPNTESDASNDSFDIPSEMLNATATEHLYEESVFGDNSQDSTETSLSQISTHLDSDEGDDTQMLWRDSKRRSKSKKKSMSDVIRVKSIGGEPMSETSMGRLKDKWQKSEDGTQVLTFTTKEIRERKPELLSYIKRAGLTHVITEKLNQEKSSIKKLVKDNESSLRQSQDKLEQHRCLMAAVLSEILSVKEQLKDLQNALGDEETICNKLRTEHNGVAKEAKVAKMKVNILKKIIDEAAQLGLTTQNIPVQTDTEAGITVGTSTTEIVSETTHQEESVVEMVVEQSKGVDTEHQVSAGGDMVQTTVIERVPEMPTVCAEGASTAQVITDQQNLAVQNYVVQETAVETDSVKVIETSVSETSHAAAVPFVSENESVQHTVAFSEAADDSQITTQVVESTVEDQPPKTIVTETISKEATQETTIIGPDGQIVRVSIQGGHSLPHNVMLELPKDILQSGQQTPDHTPMETETSALPDNIVVEQAEVSIQQVQMVGELENVVIESGNMEHEVVDTVPQASTSGVIEGQQTLAEATTEMQVVQQDTVISQHQEVAPSTVIEREQLLQQELPTQQQTVTTTDLIQDLGHLQAGHTHLATTQGLDNLTSIVTQNQTITTTANLTQTMTETTLKPISADFDNIIMRPGELGDVILQTGDMGTLSLQQQGDITSSLVVQQGDIPLTTDTVGLSTFQLDDGMIVQQDIGENYIIQQQGAGLHDKQVLLQTTTDNGTIFVQSTEALPIQQQVMTTTEAGGNVLLQPSNTQNIIIEQPQTSSAGGLQNITLQTDNPQHMLIQEQPDVVAADGGDQAGNVILQAGQDIVLQNLDLGSMQGLGQVQTIMIDGQPYQVILQAADST